MQLGDTRDVARNEAHELCEDSVSLDDAPSIVHSLEVVPKEADERGRVVASVPLAVRRLEKSHILQNSGNPRLAPTTGDRWTGALPQKGNFINRTILRSTPNPMDREDPKNPTHLRGRHTTCDMALSAF